MTVLRAVSSCFFALLLSVATGAPPAKAAEFSFSNGPPCTLRIDGVLEPGDAARLAAFTADINRHPEEDIVLCLNSAGGDLSEAIALANMIDKDYWSTYVGPEDECLSGCALAFMMGREFAPDMPNDKIARRLHIDGRLGFHRPYLPEELAGQPTFGFAGSTFDEAVKTILDVVVLANRPRRGFDFPVIRSDLLERMFDTGRDNLFLIDTIEKAAKWGVQIDGADFSIPELTRERAQLACDNLPRWSRIDDVDTGYEFSRFEEPEVPDWLTYVIGDQDPISEYQHYCLFAAAEVDGTLRVYGCIHDGNNRFFFGGRPCNPDLFRQRDTPGGGAGLIPPRAFFPPDTSLTDLPRSTDAFIGSWDWLAKRRKVARRKCSIDDPSDEFATARTVIGPARFANIRATPSLNGEVVARVRPWSRIQIVANAPVYAGSEERRASCALACNPIDRNAVLDSVRSDESSLAAQLFETTCVVPNLVWWAVELNDGTRGYISAALFR